MPPYLRPLESGADLLTLLGGVGLISGFGGKYFGLFPVIKTPSSDFGVSVFSINPPGVWSGPGQTGSSQGNLFTLGGLQVGLSYMFDLELKTSGLNANANTNYFGYLNPSKTIYEAQEDEPGPLGSHAGYYFVTMMAVGLFLRGGLEFF